MKKIGYLVLLAATAAWAQSLDIAGDVRASRRRGRFPRRPASRYSGCRCPLMRMFTALVSSTARLFPMPISLLAACDTPKTTKFVKGDIVYLKGTGYTAGAQYEIIRALHDMDEYEMFPGQSKLMKETGQPYAEVGRVRIIDTRSKTAIAHVEYACDPIKPGDTAIPFAEKTMVAFHPPVRFDRFLPSGSKVSGRIVMARDFDSVLGTGQKIYINVGANQGVKIGDYFRATRSYEADLRDPVDSLSFKAAISEDTQKKQPSLDPNQFTKGNGPVIHVRDLPRRAVGEIVVIGATPTTATGMIVFAMEDVHAGDNVELDEQARMQ